MSTSVIMSRILPSVPMMKVQRSGYRPTLMDDTVRRGHVLVRVAQHGIIEIEGLGEPRLVAAESQLAAKRAISYLSRFEPPDAGRSISFPLSSSTTNDWARPLARSELHSRVQPPVKALGNHARTTTCLPRKSARR